MKPYRIITFFIVFAALCNGQVQVLKLRSEYLNSFSEQRTQQRAFPEQLIAMQALLDTKLSGTRIEFSEAAPGFCVSNEAIVKEAAFQAVLVRHLVIRRDSLPKADPDILWRSFPGFIPAHLLDCLSLLKIQEIPDVGLGALYRNLQSGSNGIESAIVGNSRFSVADVKNGTVELTADEQRELNHAVEDARLKIVAKRLLGEERMRRKQ